MTVHQFSSLFMKCWCILAPGSSPGALQVARRGAQPALNDPHPWRILHVFYTVWHFSWTDVNWNWHELEPFLTNRTVIFTQKWHGVSFLTMFVRRSGQKHISSAHQKNDFLKSFYDPVMTSFMFGILDVVGSSTNPTDLIFLLHFVFHILWTGVNCSRV